MDLGYITYQKELSTNCLYLRNANGTQVIFMPVLHFSSEHALFREGRSGLLKIEPQNS
jgi:hypothetical protein